MAKKYSERYKELEDCSFGDYSEEKKIITTINQRELNMMLAWMSCGCKPDRTFRIDMIVLDKLRRWAKKLELDFEYESFLSKKEKVFDEDGNEMTKEEIKQLEEEKKAITKAGGKFYCPKCKMLTDEKTYETKCVLCNTSLQRRG